MSLSQWDYYRRRLQRFYYPSNYPNYKQSSAYGGGDHYSYGRKSLYNDGYARDESVDSRSDSYQEKRPGNTKLLKCLVIFFIVLVIGCIVGALLGVLLSGSGSDDKSGSSETSAGDAGRAVITGHVTLEDSQIGGYITALADPSSAAFTQRQALFCSEVADADSECTVFTLGSGSLIVRFEISKSIATDSTEAITRFQLASVLYERLMDSSGSIRGVAHEDISIDDFTSFSVEGVSVLPNRQYTSSLADADTLAYREMEQEFCGEVLSGMQTTSTTRYTCTVTSYESGSVVVYFKVGVISTTMTSSTSQTQQMKDNVQTAITASDLGASMTSLAACRSFPCANGGACSDDSDGGFTCDCAEGYTGSTCSEQISCFATPCLNRGTCGQSAATGQYVCICEAGYTGDHCETEIACVLDPTACLNGGQCVSNTDWTIKECLCTSQFKGPRCATRKTCQADGSPCQNGGTCREDVYSDTADFHCNCLEFYKGDRCQYVDVCRANNPCSQYSVCVSNDDGSLRECECDAAYRGVHCDMARVCVNNGPCVRGTCVEGVTEGAYTCDDCQDGYMGTNCDIVDPCYGSNNPCVNGATCSRTADASAECICASQHKGEHCDIDKACLLNNGGCLNGATCVENAGTGRTCQCVTGYRGDDCHIEDQCTTQSPCQNGGACVQAADGTFQRCDCSQTNFKGSTCSTARSCAADGSSCDNGATCLEGDVGHTCSCAAGFTGNRCQTVIPDSVTYSVIGDVTLLQVNWPTARTTDQDPTFCNEVMPSDFFPDGTQRTCTSTFTSYEDPIDFNIQVTEPGVSLVGSEYDEHVLDRRVRLANQVMMKLSDNEGQITDVNVNNITIAGLFIFRHEAQIVISNKEYTPAVGDSNSDEYQQLENDMCGTIVGTSQSQPEVEHNCRLIAIESGSWVATVRTDTVMDKPANETEAFSEVTKMMKDNLESMGSSAYTIASVQVNSQVCPPGFEAFSVAEDIVVCTQCIIGFYKTNYANTACTGCPDGFITAAPGATSADNCTVPDCAAGSYVDGSVCSACPLDTYQADARQESCDNCAASQITLQTGSNSQAQCLDAVFYSLHADVTYSGGVYQYTNILQQENSQDFLDMQDLVCSQFHGHINASIGRVECRASFFGVQGEPRLEASLTLSVKRMRPSPLPADFVNADKFELVQDLVWDDNAAYGTISIDGYSNDVITLVMVMSSTAVRRRRTTDEMHTRVCVQISSSLPAALYSETQCEITNVYTYGDGYSVKFVINWVHSTAQQYTVAGMIDDINSILAAAHGQNASRIGSSCATTDCEQTCTDTPSTQCTCTNAYLHDDGIHCIGFQALIFPNHTAEMVHAGEQFHMRCMALVEESVRHDSIEITWSRLDGDTLTLVQTDILDGVLVVPGADDEPFKFVALFFTDLSVDHSGDYVCAVTYQDSHTTTANVTVRVDACDPGYFHCRPSISQTQAVAAAPTFSMSLVVSPSPVDYPGAPGIICLNVSHLCDGMFDCESRSDEYNCPDCVDDPNRFSCSNGLCINMGYRCDGYDDCGDGSDEFDCPPGADCVAGHWKCPSSGICIPIAERCENPMIVIWTVTSWYQSYTYRQYRSMFCDCPEVRYNTTGLVTCDDELHCDCSNATARPYYYYSYPAVSCPGDTGECFFSRDFCDRTPHCSDWSDERAPRCLRDCYSYEFQCAQGNCISDYDRCDGRNDCGDWSDEEGCYCYSYQHQCPRGTCISTYDLCDGYNDCGDWSDELLSSCVCPSWQYKCPRTGLCIDKALFCDGTQDCPLGEDEYENCHLHCQADAQITCAPERICISDVKRCDHSFDCSDRSDELHCDCNDDEIRCNDTLCLHESKWCDDVIDCLDESDEPPFCYLASCPLGYLACDNKCINPRFRCDGVVHCPNTYIDEIVGCPPCTEQQMQCANGACISDERWCDAVDHCRDGSDEPVGGCPSCSPNKRSCTNTPTRCYYPSESCDGVLSCDNPPYDDEVNCTCTEHEFRCDFGMCISKTRYCDGTADCIDGSDEPANCTCFDGYQYTCRGGLCIDIAKDCDGIQHCPEANDDEDGLRCPCPDGEWKCDNFKCIAESLLCNNRDDCDGDYSDEKHENCTCQSNQLRCDVGTCIWDDGWCDGSFDCPDGSDEKRDCPSGCLNGTFKCYERDFTNFECMNELFFECSTGQCIGDHQITPDCYCSSFRRRCHWGKCLSTYDFCDNSNECFDWSDEINCGACSSSEIRCNASTVHANSGPNDYYCISRSSYACDWVRDCPFGEDEDPEICGNIPDVLNTCGSFGALDASQGGAVGSPNYPRNYGDSHRCYWTINADIGYRVRLSVAMFSTESCCDYLTINDLGTGSRLFYRSGSVSPTTITSSSNSVQLYFYTDSSVTYPGFLIYYSQVSSTGTGAASEASANGGDGSGGTAGDDGSTDGALGSRNGSSTLVPNTALRPTEAPTDCTTEHVYNCTGASEGSCVWFHQRCDGSHDCEDRTDEDSCICDVGSHFTCSDGSCIRRARQCDGYDDCLDNSDEWSCECAPGFWYCESKRLCLLDEWRCDGFQDCDDPDDEIVANCSKCEDYEFECENYDCIESSSVCDASNDCGDGTDETTCLQYDVSNSPVALAPGGGEMQYHICAASNYSDNQAIADLACLELGYSGSGSTFTTTNISSHNVMVVDDPLPSNSIREGASFYNASEALTACDSCHVIDTLRCSALECGSPTHDPDGNPIPDVVVNGDDADIESWPWQVSLRRCSSGSCHFCGGSIINREWILTAAHCEYSFTTVAVGSADRRTPQNTYSARRWVLHPGYADIARYNVGYFGNINDVALIQLSSPISAWTDTVKPVCLPNANQDSNSFRRCYITGWGQYDPEYRTGNSYDIMQQGKVNIVPTTTCQNWYYDRWARIFPYKLPYQAPIDGDYHVCVGRQSDRGHITSCFGDSGGPVSCQSSENGRWYVRGVSSTVGSLSCDRLGIYASVHTHVDWIQSVIDQYGIYT